MDNHFKCSSDEQNQTHDLTLLWHTCIQGVRHSLEMFIFMTMHILCACLP